MLVQISCPARIDIGNRLDYPSHFFSLPSQGAKTANISINLMTTISYSPNSAEIISLSTESISEQHERGRLDPSKSRLPLLCAILNHFGVDSGTFRISSQVPYGSGLGGSGILVVSLIALIKRLRLGVISEADYPSLCMTAHLLENWLGFSTTGFQDQLAALHGGANLWTWGAELESGGTSFYRRTPILPVGGTAQLDEHILLCFTGQRHRPSRISKRARMLSGADLGRWTEVSQQTENFAVALRDSDWRSAARCLNAECDLRIAIDPTCLSSRAQLLVTAGRSLGLGCRYAGHGSGGAACGRVGDRRRGCNSASRRQVA
jgi:galactokinase/mevalonate kinase-like predicted kinase